MKLYILDIGWLEGDANWMVAMSVLGTLENKNPLIKWIKIPVYAVLIDHPDGKILYDTGCHPQAMSGYWPPSLKSIFPHYHNDNQLLVKQLELAGTAPKDIKKVILSHLHLDHAGNSYLFENADFYIHKKDYEYAQSLINSSSNPSDYGSYVKADVQSIPKKNHLVDNDTALTENIELISLPGHTPGVLGLIVHLEKGGTLIFPMDAVYTKENYGPPVKMSGIIYDSVSFVKSIEKVRALQRKYAAKVMFSHDMQFFKTLKVAPQYYE